MIAENVCGDKTADPIDLSGPFWAGEWLSTSTRDRDNTTKSTTVKATPEASAAA
jgi:hypothetical protein